MAISFVKVALNALHPCVFLSLFRSLLNLVLERQAGRLQMPAVIQQEEINEIVRKELLERTDCPVVTILKCHGGNLD